MNASREIHKRIKREIGSDCSEVFGVAEKRAEHPEESEGFGEREWFANFEAERAALAGGVDVPW
jgi:hypothetical protein